MLQTYSDLLKKKQNSMVYSNLLSINDLLNVLFLVLGNKIDTWGAVNRGRLAAAPWVLSRYGKGKPHAIDYTQEY
jgi:hypothetical protein